MASSNTRHIRLASRIADTGVELLNPCSRCMKRGIICTMSSLSKRCSACVLSGRTCRWELHSDSEWDELPWLTGARTTPVNAPPKIADGEKILVKELRIFQQPLIQMESNFVNML
jgi:hypothetical protein